MIEFVDTHPDVSVQAAEYKRLLGYPRDWVVSGRALELTEWARDWYAQYGRPWVYSRQASRMKTCSGSICIDDFQFASPRLVQTLDDAEADRIVIVAVSAGPELEETAQQLWREEKPDEYFFLEVYGSAVVEHLITMHGARLCAWAESQDLAVLPHYSPGYPDWDIAQQPKLLELIRQTREHQLPAQLEVLCSGMLRPKKSLLAVFGVTPHAKNVLRLTELNPCESCSFLPCQYRRAPYRRALPYSDELVAQTRQAASRASSLVSVLDRNAKYVVNAKALARWSTDRLKLTCSENGTIDAMFHYEGTTCSNMGRRLSFHYRVKLGSRKEGYPIRNACCCPAPDDEGHLSMCRFMDDPQALKVVLDREKPLLGRPLNDVLRWENAGAAAGCYCESIDRLHKWRLVLETIHYALVQREGSGFGVQPLG
ncbi:MAG TPA: hypothetical protein VGM76_08755 [Lacipirellulaceae bacterium]|jgi:hypothetical protein